MLYREGYYDEDCAEPDLTDCLIRKNRQGPTRNVSIALRQPPFEFIVALFQ